ncbi:MAG: hypothetical protein ACXVLQ_09335 [Bacteriovorax sp.]
MAGKYDPKSVCKDKMHLAMENLRQAELEGAEKLAPETYAWAKQKIYANEKVILHYPDDQRKIEEATDDASAAAAKLLSIVRRHIRSEKMEMPKPEILEQEAIKNLANEGGPVK